MSQTDQQQSTLPYYAVRSRVRSLRQLRLAESASFSVEIHFNPSSAVPSPSSLCKLSPRLEWVEGKCYGGEWYQLLAVITAPTGFYKVSVRVRGVRFSEVPGTGVADTLASLLNGIGAEVSAEDCEVDLERDDEALDSDWGQNQVCSADSEANLPSLQLLR